MAKFEKGEKAMMDEWERHESELEEMADAFNRKYGYYPEMYVGCELKRPCVFTDVDAPMILYARKDGKWATAYVENVNALMVSRGVHSMTAYETFEEAANAFISRKTGGEFETVEALRGAVA